MIRGVGAVAAAAVTVSVAWDEGDPADAFRSQADRVCARAHTQLLDAPPLEIEDILAAAPQVIAVTRRTAADLQRLSVPADLRVPRGAYVARLKRQAELTALLLAAARRHDDDAVHGAAAGLQSNSLAARRVGADLGACAGSSTGTRRGPRHESAA